jgi:hypothetical protein
VAHDTGWEEAQVRWWKRKPKLPEAALLTIGHELQDRLVSDVEPLPAEFIKQVRQLERAQAEAPVTAPRQLHPTSGLEHRQPMELSDGAVRPWLNRRFPDRLRVHQAKGAARFIQQRVEEKASRVLHSFNENRSTLLFIAVLGPIIGWAVGWLARLL